MQIRTLDRTDLFPTISIFRIGEFPDWLAFRNVDPIGIDLLLARDGDGRAFGRVVERTEVDVRRFCRWFIGPEGDLDDLVQETYLRAFRGLGGFMGVSSGRSWLLSISRRACLDMVEARRRDSMIRELEPRAVRSSTGDFAEGVVLHEIIASIPQVYRDAFILVKVMGLTHDEVATVLGCPIGTVQSRVARARVLLAGMIENPPESRGCAG